VPVLTIVPGLADGERPETGSVTTGQGYSSGATPTSARKRLVDLRMRLAKSYSVDVSMISRLQRNWRGG
jgi:hypothetical protein